MNRTTCQSALVRLEKLGIERDSLGDSDALVIMAFHVPTNFAQSCSLLFLRRKVEHKRLKGCKPKQKK